MNLYRAERKFGKFAIPNLMFYIVVAQFTVFLVDMLIPQLHLRIWLGADRSALFQGQIWRIITFIFLPPNSSPIFIIFSLYFYYMIGSVLEQSWGTFKFNIYYLVGMIGTLIASLLTGYADNMYLNFSMFFAYAILYPNNQVLLFFMIPIKIKYLALIDALFFAANFVSGSWSTKAAIVFSLINLFLFFGKDFFINLKNQNHYRKNQQNFRNYMNQNRW